MSAVFPINVDVRWRSHTASAGQVEFSIPFPFQDDDDITIVRVALDGSETTLTRPADYTISGAGNPAGGSYTLVVPAVAGEKYGPVGRTVLQRILSIVRGGRYKSAATDADLDRLMITAQEHRRDIDRAWKAPLGFGAGRIVPGTAGELMTSDGAGDIVGSGENVATILGSTAAAAGSAALAQKWAENPEDVPVIGMLFSAMHWAKKAQAAVVGNIGAAIHSLTAKAPLVDADEMVLSDSAAAWASKRITWANIKATIATAFGAMIATMAAKTTLVDADLIALADSAASNASKSITVDNLRKTLAAGKQTLVIRADEFLPTLSNGAALGVRGVATSNLPLATMNFDTTSQEYARAPISLPKKWNKGTVTAEVVWAGASAGSGGVTFSVGVCAWGDGDNLQTIGGSAQNSADTYQGADLLHVSPVTGNITVGQTPLDGDLLYVLLSRVVADANDTLAQDAQVIAVRLFYNVTTSNDA